MPSLLKRIEAILFHNAFVFILVLIVINIIIIKIPFHRLFVRMNDYDIAKNLERSIHGLIIITGSIFLIKRLKLDRFAGIKVFAVNSPWLLIIPFIYPMGLAFFSFPGTGPDEISISFLALVLLAFILKGLAEEYAFRGLLQSYLIKKLNNRISLFRIICLSALIFALMHIINISRYGVIDVINQVTAAFFFGVFFGALLLRTGNVFLLGVIHGCINFVFAFNSLVRKDVQNGPKYLESFSEVVLVLLKYSLFFLPLFFIGFFLIRRKNIISILSGQTKTI